MIDWEAFTDPVDVENKLKYDCTESVAYAVNGHWYRREDDEIGKYGTWWCAVSELYEWFPDDVVDELIDDFDAYVKEAKDEHRRAAREASRARQQAREAEEAASVAGASGA